MNHHRWQQDGKEVGHDEHLQLIKKREDAEITEEEQCYQPDNRQIERGKQHAHNTSRQNHLLFVPHLNYQLSIINYQLSTINYQLSTSDAVAQSVFPTPRGIWLPYDGQWDSPSLSVLPSVHRHLRGYACLPHQRCRARQP